MTTAEYLGTKHVYNGARQSLYRLTAPLQDIIPPVRNVVLIECVNGDRLILPAVAYEGIGGQWKAIPGSGTWIRSYSSLSARDHAFALTDIGEG